MVLIVLRDLVADNSIVGRAILKPLLDGQAIARPMASDGERSLVVKATLEVGDRRFCGRWRFVPGQSFHVRFQDCEGIAGWAQMVYTCMVWCLAFMMSHQLVSFTTSIIIWSPPAHQAVFSAPWRPSRIQSWTKMPDWIVRNGYRPARQDRHRASSSYNTFVRNFLTLFYWLLTGRAGCGCSWPLA